VLHVLLLIALLTIETELSAQHSSVERVGSIALIRIPTVAGELSRIRHWDERAWLELRLPGALLYTPLASDASGRYLLLADRKNLVSVIFDRVNKTLTPIGAGVDGYIIDGRVYTLDFDSGTASVYDSERQSWQKCEWPLNFICGRAGANPTNARLRIDGAWKEFPYSWIWPTPEPHVWSALQADENRSARRLVVFDERDPASERELCVNVDAAVASPAGEFVLVRFSGAWGQRHAVFDVAKRRQVDAFDHNIKEGGARLACFSIPPQELAAAISAACDVYIDTEPPLRPPPWENLPLHDAFDQEADRIAPHNPTVAAGLRRVGQIVRRDGKKALDENTFLLDALVRDDPFVSGGDTMIVFVLDRRRRIEAVIIEDAGGQEIARCEQQRFQVGTKGRIKGSVFFTGYWFVICPGAFDRADNNEVTAKTISPTATDTEWTPILRAKFTGDVPLFVRVLPGGERIELRRLVETPQKPR
jgi:hypothetical protein